jgi:hypothetical protein
MRRCVLCTRDGEDVTLIQVAPAAWTGFNNFVGVCAECQTSEIFKKRVKQKKAVPRPAPAESKA